MLVCDHFVYIHLRKTGGLWLRSVMLEHAPAAWQLRDLTASHGRHGAWDALPVTEKQKPAVCFVRNPFTWYVSLFTMALRDYRSGSRHSDAYGPGGWHVGGPRYTEEAQWAPVLEDLPEDPRTAFQVAVKERGALLGPTVGSVAAPAFCLSDEVRRQCGLGVDFRRYEALRDETVAFLRQVAPPCPALERAVLSCAPDHVRQREHATADYYDAALVARVLEHDADIFEAFGYPVEPPC